MNTGWNDKPLHYKIASISSIIVSIAIIVLAVIQLVDLWPDAGYVYVPLMGIHLLLQAYVQWEPNRKIARWNLWAAVFVLLCAVVVYILK